MKISIFILFLLGFIFTSPSISAQCNTTIKVGQSFNWMKTMTDGSATESGQFQILTIENENFQVQYVNTTTSTRKVLMGKLSNHLFTLTVSETEIWAVECNEANHFRGKVGELGLHIDKQ